MPIINTLEEFYQSDDDRKLLIFTHIPKCAGTSMTKSFVQVYGQGHIKYPQTWQEWLKVRGEIDSMPNVSVLAGHHPFGLHEFTSRPVCYVTILREPVDRLVSLYKYVSARPDHEYYSISHGHSFDYFIERVVEKYSNELNNLQCFYISGQRTAEEAISSAVHNYALVGVTEDTEPFFQKMQSKLHWDPQKVAMKIENATNNNALEISKQTLEIIRQRSAADFKLHEYFMHAWGKRSSK